MLSNFQLTQGSLLFSFSIVFIFFMCVFGFLIVSRSLIHKIMCLEILSLIVNMHLIFFGVQFADIKASVFVLFLLAIIAGETVLLLSLLVLFEQD